MKAPIYNLKGKTLKKIELSEDIFGKKVNNNLVHQVYTSLLSNRRKPLAFSKDRSEVRGGGKKPWRQKGTGRARHGSIRSPLWKGGGVTFGPRAKERDFKKKINKKIKKDAIKMVLSQKFRDGEIKIIEDIDLKEHKTSQMDKFFRSLLKIEKKFPKVLFLIDSKNEVLRKSAKNLPYIKIMNAENIDLIEILNNKYLVISKNILPILENK
jgi:large subunit ribosomal protein L4